MLASNASVYFGIPGLKKIHHPMTLSPPKQGTFKDDDFHVPLWLHMLDLHPTHSSPWFLHFLWQGIGTFATSQHPWVGGRLDPTGYLSFLWNEKMPPQRPGSQHRQHPASRWSKGCDESQVHGSTRRSAAQRQWYILGGGAWELYHQ